MTVSLFHFAYHQLMTLCLLQAILRDGDLLCKKDTCTTSHILGAWKVTLSQGKFTFCHGNVLRMIINNIRSSIKSIKSTVPTSKQPIKIKFVKKGNQSKKQTIFSQRDITSSMRLGLVRGSR